MNTNKNKDESQRVGKAVEAEKRQCYISSMRVIWNVPEYADADYVEGIAVFHNCLMFEHGWVEHEGIILDPTLPNDDLTYFAGLRFAGGLGIADALRIPKPSDVEDLPILNRFGWGGTESPEFRSARVAALRYSGDERQAKRYEEWQALDAAEV